VFICDRQWAVREGFRLYLTGIGCEVVGETEAHSELLSRLAGSRAGVVVLDCDIPYQEISNLLVVLKQKFPLVAIIGVTCSDDAASVSGLVELGLSGYLLRSGPREELMLAIRAAPAGQMFLSAGAASVLARENGRLKNVGGVPADIDLTPRRWEAAQLLATKMTRETICEKMCIGTRTFYSHRSVAFQRLGVTSREQLRALLKRLGLLNS